MAEGHDRRKGGEGDEDRKEERVGEGTVVEQQQREDGGKYGEGGQGDVSPTSR